MKNHGKYNVVFTNKQQKLKEFVEYVLHRVFLRAFSFNNNS